jgi:ubiquinone/menaquinone biosynthesis C-methylase UbiE
MEEAEFDRFADEYRQIHAANIRISGEQPDYFAEYKIKDVAALEGPTLRKGNPSILDFGAGVGTSVPYFRRYFPNCRLTCLDVSRKSLDIGRSRFAGSAEFVHFDGEAIPFPDEQFDLVFLACVLHHIAHGEHAALLREMSRVLRPDGEVVIFEHNPYNPLTVRAVNTCPFDENAVLLRPYRLARLVRQVGFARTSLRFRIFFPRSLRALRVLEPWLVGIPLGAQYFVRGWKGEQ